MNVGIAKARNEDAVHAVEVAPAETPVGVERAAGAAQEFLAVRVGVVGDCVGARFGLDGGHDEDGSELGEELGEHDSEEEAVELTDLLCFAGCSMDVPMWTLLRSFYRARVGSYPILELEDTGPSENRKSKIENRREMPRVSGHEESTESL